VQCVGGFHTVLGDDNKLYTCTARGRIKHTQGEIVVGDFVVFQETSEALIIEEVLPRRHFLRRPLVANVDQAVMVFALHNPEPLPLLMDKFLVSVEAADLPIILCLNKVDLTAPRVIKEISSRFQDAGYQVITASARKHIGRNKLLAQLYGKTSVFCGPSGVGKSALMNMLSSTANQETGDLSTKIQRGKHTTRQVRLIPLRKQSYIVDTPGYTQVDLGVIQRRQLQHLFPEISNEASSCRFQGCFHDQEPDCAVKKAVEEKRIHAQRYNSYREILAELSSFSETRR
jgi:ribosome biogenesis GTPase / thiamine phosphate phosphatase